MKIPKKYSIYKNKKETTIALDNGFIIFDNKVPVEGTIVEESAPRMPRVVKPKHCTISNIDFENFTHYISKVLPRQGKTSIHYATDWLYFRKGKGMYYSTDIMAVHIPSKVANDFVMPIGAVELMIKMFDKIGRLPAAAKVEVGLSCTRVTFRKGAVLIFETGGEDMAVPSKYKTTFNISITNKYKVDNFLLNGAVTSELTRIHKKDKTMYIRFDKTYISSYSIEGTFLIKDSRFSHKLKFPTNIKGFDIVMPVVSLIDMIKYDKDLMEKKKIEIAYGDDAYIFFFDKYCLINDINLIKT